MVSDTYQRLYINLKINTLVKKDVALATSFFITEIWNFVRKLIGKLKVIQEY